MNKPGFWGRLEVALIYKYSKGGVRPEPASLRKADADVRGEPKLRSRSHPHPKPLTEKRKGEIRIHTDTWLSKTPAMEKKKKFKLNRSNNFH